MNKKSSRNTSLELDQKAGALELERPSRVARKVRVRQHWHAGSKQGGPRETHGKSKTPEFICWEHMRHRCYNPKTKCYHNYGGRGIKVCDRWLHSFSNFVEDMGMRPSGRHTLERIDNDGNYEPSNCKWATYVEQINNRRTNRFLEFDGKRLTMAQWARELGIKKETLAGRIRRGGSIDAALKSPVKTRCKKLTLNGETLLVKEWAARYGINRWLIDQRLNDGWSIERAITEPNRYARRPA
jgi:hypothetical protein